MSYQNALPRREIPKADAGYRGKYRLLRDELGGKRANDSFRGFMAGSPGE